MLRLQHFYATKFYFHINLFGLEYLQIECWLTQKHSVIYYQYDKIPFVLFYFYGNVPSRTPGQIFFFTLVGSDPLEERWKISKLYSFLVFILLSFAFSSYAVTKPWYKYVKRGSDFTSVESSWVILYQLP